MKRILVNIWNNSYDIFIHVKNYFYVSIDSIYGRIHNPPKIMSIEDTIQYIKDNKCSVSRLGDGEIKIACGKDLAFQRANTQIRMRMIEVMSVPIKNHIVCLPDIFKDLSCYNDEAYNHWKLHLAYYRKYWYKHIDRRRLFYNAFISRCYMMFIDKSRSEEYFKNIKGIWENRNVLLIEGEKRRLGVGNDLFDNVSSIRRILAPNKNAFDYYDKIITKIIELAPYSYLLLLAIGPTATVMSYDLAKKGYQAVDIGHIDIEYEWLRMKALQKKPVKDKFVNEAGAGKGVGESNDIKYLKEIICRF